MDADGTAARRADPAGVLDCHESVQSQLTDAVQVLDHAHAVLGPIAQVQLSQSSARVLRAVETEGGALGSLGTQLDTADHAVFLLWSLLGETPGTAVPVAQESGTDPAVHAAGCHHGRRNAGRALQVVLT